MARNTNLLAMALEAPKRPRKSSVRDGLLEALIEKNTLAPEPVHSVGYGLTKVANAALLGFLDTKKDRDEKSERSRMADLLFGSLGGADSKPETSALAKVLKGEKITPEGKEGSFVDRVVRVESGGNPYAKNPRSSATGPGQFIDSTWIDVVTANKPEIAQGRSREELLALRSDPELSREMTDAYGNQNAQFLQSQGLPVDDGTKYLAHFAGPGGAAKVLSAEPTAPVRGILGNQVVEANPFLADWTAADLQRWASDKMGGSAGSDDLTGGTMRPQGAPPAPEAAQIAPGMPRQEVAAPEPVQAQQGGLGSFLSPQEQQTLRALYESGEITGAQVMQFVEQKRAAQQPDYAYETMPDGTLLQIDKRTGQAKPVYESGQKPTSAIQEFEYAQQNPEFVEQQLRLKAAGANKTVGAPQAGYRYEYDAQGNVVQASPIPGSPAAQEAEAAQQQAEQRGEQRDRYADVVTTNLDTSINRLMNSNMPLAGIGSLAAGLPGTPQRDLAANLDTIRANVGFDRLQAMREASPTGGALGAVSDRENQMLQATLGNLEQSQSREQLINNLIKLQNIYKDVVYGTPEKIAALAQQGALSPEDAEMLSQRQPLPFDDFGNPVIAETGESVPPEEVLRQAREALAEGRSREVIVKMLKQMGIDPSGL